jgi:hypothetical protein
VYKHTDINELQGVKDQTFKPCPACERVIERIVRMEVVEETTI